MASSTTALEHFGAKLFSSISQQKKDQNVFFSPASIALAISMCTIGARHETLEQMLRTLEVSSTEQLTKTAEQVMQVFPPADKDEPSITPLADPDAPIVPVFYSSNQLNSLELKLANRLYVEKKFQIQQEYLNLVQKSFQSDLKLEDFEHKSAKAVQTINTWVEERTNKKICDILSPKDITSDTQLVLINCIYFKGEWEDEFNKRNTDKDANFHGANGSITKIELMYQKEYYSYAENEDLGVQIAHLPYRSSNEDTKFVFTVVLPKQGVQLEQVEQKLTSDKQLRQQVLSNQGVKSKELLLYLPKFKLETKYELKDVLIKLGMEQAFSDKKADFEGIIGKVDDRNRVFISKVIHKTFLNVNEEGTEAAAASVITMQRVGCSPGSQKPSPIEFKADRPFLFFIREVQRDIILFSGKLVSPTASNE